MEDAGTYLLITVLAGLVFRLSSERERAKRRGPGMPARFVHFIGRRLRITTRTD